MLLLLLGPSQLWLVWWPLLSFGLSREGGLGLSLYASQAAPPANKIKEDFQPLARLFTRILNQVHYIVYHVLKVLEFCQIAHVLILDESLEGVNLNSSLTS